MKTTSYGHIKDTIKEKIKTSDPHSVFFISDFTDIGSPETIRKIYVQMTMDGTLEKVGKGIYAKPKESRFGKVPVPIETIAREIAARDKCQILPTGSTAANIIGLSTQVPMVLSYITSGSTRTVTIGDRKLNFRHASPKNFAAKGLLAPLLIQGLKEIGEDNISTNHYSALINFIEKNPDSHLDEDLRLAPMWIQKIIKTLMHRQKQ